MLSKILCLTFLVGTGLAFLASPREPAAPPASNMLRLVTSSEFAVVARVVNTTGVRKRLSREELLKLDDLSKTLGGTLYTIRVEEVISSRADFVSGDAVPPRPGDTVLIFKRRDGPYSPNELYVKDQKYLIFLNPIQDQEGLVKEYELSAGKVYYRASDPEAGIIPISSFSLPLVSRFRQLGAAVKSPDPRQKIKRLRILAHAPDEELKEAATEAISLIQANSRR